MPQDLETRLAYLYERKLGLNRKYNTIAHDFLDVEAEADFEDPDHNVTDDDYQVLDDIIDEAQKRINEIKLDKPFTEYTKDEAVSVLEEIGDTLEDWGFEYQETDLINTGLKTKNIDCKHSTLIYLAVAESLDLPLAAVRVPRHVFTRWNLGNDNYFNWETVHTEERSDEHYILKNKVLDELVEKGVYLTSLSRKNFCFIAYQGIGHVLLGLVRNEEALESYDKAIKLDPNYFVGHSSKGATLHRLGRYEEALECYNKALKLNPDDYLAYRNRNRTLNQLKKTKE